LVSDDTEKVFIDSKETYKNINQFVDKFVSDVEPSKIIHYENKEPIFDYFAIEKAMERALTNRVWLKSGGYIIIEQTEALLTIDVNTGKYVGKGNFEDTILKINLEAAREIAYQLRLRNIGGLVVIDFIDMAYQQNRGRVYDEFVNELKKDRAKCTLLPISDLGLLQMTRKRTRETLSKYLSETCTYCSGKGYLKSRKAICYEIIRKLRGIDNTGEPKPISIYAHPAIIEMLGKEEMDTMHQVEKKLKRVIFVHPKLDFHQGHYEIVEG
jgi:ribonuclease G